MIDVIIPAYNAHETIEHTLSSIAFQDCVDILNVYIIDDCSDSNYDELVKFYSNFMNIKELRMEKNGGPGLARQFGIDNSNSDYLIFIDSDDVFTDIFAISRLYNAIVNENADISLGGFLEELDSGFSFQDCSYVWMHSKVYRRQFLDDNNIRFNSTRANEDCGFNHLCYLCGSNSYEVGGTSYIWRNNKNSITRINSGKTFQRKMKEFTYNMLWALEEAYKRNFNEDRFASIAYGILVSTYHYYLQDPEIFIEDQILEQIAPLVKYCDLYPLNDDGKKSIIRSQLMAEVSGPELIKVYDPDITLKEFVSMLRDKLVDNEVND